MADSYPMTPKGLLSLKEELKFRKEVERPKIVRAIEEARAHGDLSENAEYTAAKEAMFWYTDTEWAPWTVVRSNDKKRGRLEAMRWVLSRVDYPEKDLDVVGAPDRSIVGPPADIYESEENTGRVFPPL